MCRSDIGFCGYEEGAQNDRACKEMEGGRDGGCFSKAVHKGKGNEHAGKHAEDNLPADDATKEQIHATDQKTAYLACAQSGMLRMGVNKPLIRMNRRRKKNMTNIACCSVSE